MRKILTLVPIIAVMLLGCAKHYIPNTEIIDNKDNRDILDFCERYRHAVEDLNIGLLISLASPRYFDNSATMAGDDDMDRAGLEEVLKERFKSINAVRYEMRYRNIYVDDSGVHVEYTYTMSFQYTIEDKKKWSNKTADNRLDLERVNGGFLILSGM